MTIADTSQLVGADSCSPLHFLTLWLLSHFYLSLSLSLSLSLFLFGLTAGFLLSLAGAVARAGLEGAWVGWGAGSGALRSADGLLLASAAGGWAAGALAAPFCRARVLGGDSACVVPSDMSSARADAGLVRPGVTRTALGCAGSRSVAVDRNTVCCGDTTVVRCAVG